MAKSREERLTIKREAEKRRCEAIKDDPIRLAAEKTKRQERKQRQRKKTTGKKKLSSKEVKLQREKWKLAKRKYNEKKKAVAVAAEIEDAPSSARANSIRKKKKMRTEWRRVKQYFIMNKLKAQVASANNRASKYKMRYLRLKGKENSASKSPKSKLERQLTKDREKVSPNVKRQLLLGKAIEADLNESFSAIKSTKTKNILSESISLKHVRKYRLTNLAKPSFKFRTFSQKCERPLLGKKRKQMMRVLHHVTKFYEDDENSVYSPAKGDQIVRDKIKKKKRFLTNSLKYLFVKYCEQSPYSISYAKFCSLRPFWVVSRPVDQRDTCLCEKCENPRMMCEQLKLLNLVSEKNIDFLIQKEMCCEIVTEACRFRTCENCRDKNIQFGNYVGEEKCSYYAWIVKVETGRDDKEYRHTGKERIHCSVGEFVARFKGVIVPYMKHVGNWLHQSRIIKELKSKLTEEAVLFHIDFAENFGCKYATELQVIHFGGNQVQISLHTGVLYEANKKQAFCTASVDTDHSACAIFTHLQPILEPYWDTIKHLHFVSDGPATQYHNRHMFHIIYHKMIPLFSQLELFSWNFTESGHGKGPADGVGACVKNTCNEAVAHGKDVANFKQFLEATQGLNINVIGLNSVQNADLIKEVTPSSQKVKGENLTLML